MIKLEAFVEGQEVDTYEACILGHQPVGQC